MASSNPNRVYEDFDPPSDLVSEEACDTSLLYLPGFRKEQLRVQLTPSRVLKITGERPMGDNKWRRFQKEFRLPSNCDTKEITAKFEGGILYIRQPKVITPAATATATATAQQQPGKPALGAPPPQPQPQPHPQPQAQPEKDHAWSSKHSKEKGEKKEDTMVKKDGVPRAPMPQAQPQPQKQQAAPPSDMPKLEEGKNRGERKEDEMRKGESELIGNRPKQVFHGSGLFRELRKPENTKRLVVSVVMVLAIGFYVSYIFKSFTGNEQERMSGSDQLEL